MDLKSFHQKAVDIINENKMGRLLTGVDVTWCLQTVSANEIVCTCQIIAVSVRNQYIAVKEVTPDAALSVFKAKVEEWASSRSVATSMYFNQEPAKA